MEWFQSSPSNLINWIRNEEGMYYSLDLGGTNFRVLQVQLGGKGSMILNSKVEQQLIPHQLMMGKSEELFNFIAPILKQFVQREGDGFEQKPDNRKDLGFTFSFPVKQLSVSSGGLIKWTKGFSIKDAVGKDVAHCLNEAMSEAGLNMQVAALKWKSSIKKIVKGLNQVQMWEYHHLTWTS
ncbi:hypothetical protein Cni_G22515 [Canna indica]|uniref:Phosphotransferase n=1 Tax=Canna indica TaxID=4628 RepID=A0AAQ3KRE2_9LILI|nr:hypothetical protein Cni_G22515 [Canna indica]